MYGLRKINRDGLHHNFQWPLEVGATAKCPDWNPEPECGGGLHMLPEAIGNYDLLTGDYWCVVEFDEQKMVRIDDQKAKVPECKIVYLSESPDGLKDFFDFNKFDSKTAYLWGINIGDRDLMRARITDSEYAYRWTRDSRYYAVDRKREQAIMRGRITNSEYAYYWALNIGDKETMRDLVTEPTFAFKWAFHIGDREIMRDRVTDSGDAYWWAVYFGDREIMRNRITDPYWIERFNSEFGETKCTD